MHRPSAGRRNRWWSASAPPSEQRAEHMWANGWSCASTSSRHTPAHGSSSADVAGSSGTQLEPSAAPSRGWSTHKPRRVSQRRGLGHCTSRPQAGTQVPPAFATGTHIRSSRPWHLSLGNGSPAPVNSGAPNAQRRTHQLLGGGRQAQTPERRNNRRRYRNSESSNPRLVRPGASRRRTRQTRGRCRSAAGRSLPPHRRVVAAGKAKQARLAARGGGAAARATGAGIATTAVRRTWGGFASDAAGGHGRRQARLRRAAATSHVEQASVPPARPRP